MSNRQPVVGVYQNKDGEFVDIYSGEIVSPEDVKMNMMPMNGIYLDKDGIEREISFGSGGGGGGITVEKDPIFSTWLNSTYTSDISSRPTTQEVADVINQAVDSLEESDPIAMEALNAHIAGDDARWSAINKIISDLRVELKQFVADTYAGTAVQYDYSQTITILMAGGLINLADQGIYTVPQNGAIQAQVGGLLGAGLNVLVNGETVWTAPLNLLVPLNSSEIKVNAGDEVSFTGLVGVGQTIQVDYFPNKGL
jgi:hypothetical protein